MTDIDHSSRDRTRNSRTKPTAGRSSVERGSATWNAAVPRLAEPSDDEDAGAEELPDPRVEQAGHRVDEEGEVAAGRVVRGWVGAGSAGRGHRLRRCQ